MENFIFQSPTQIYAGSGLIGYVGKYVRRSGGSRVLLLTPAEQSAAQPPELIDLTALLQLPADPAAQAEQAFDDLGLYYVRRSVSSHPQAEEVRDLAHLIAVQHLDFILAIGGGSEISCAKAAALASECDGDFFRRFFVQRLEPTAALPVGAVVTVPGSGCGVSPWCFITGPDAEGKERRIGLESELIYPRFTILSPELTLNLSQRQLSCACAEIAAALCAAYCSPCDLPLVSDRLCEGALQAVLELGRRLHQDSRSYDLRFNLLWAAVQAHNGQFTVGRPLDFSLLRFIDAAAAVHDCPRGDLAAVLLPAWLEELQSRHKARLSQLGARVCGISYDFADPGRTARLGIAALRAFFHELGLPLSLSALGFTPDELMHLLARAPDLITFAGRTIPLTQQEIENIFRRASEFKAITLGGKQQEK